MGSMGTVGCGSAFGKTDTAAPSITSRGNVPPCDLSWTDCSAGWMNIHGGPGQWEGLAPASEPDLVLGLVVSRLF